MKHISKEQQERVLELLTDGLICSEKLWRNEEESHAYIIGYLQGVIKLSIKELNETE